MTKKYYFTCPIKAAYMNHEFGVITYIELSIKGEIYDRYFIKDWNHRELELDAKDKYHHNKYYVAPESEHIFEPKEGDIGIYQQRVNVIYRDSKHFFMPKVELNK